MHSQCTKINLVLKDTYALSVVEKRVSLFCVFRLAKIVTWKTQNGGSSFSKRVAYDSYWVLRKRCAL